MNRMLTMAALLLALGLLAGCSSTGSGLRYVAEDGSVRTYDTRPINPHANETLCSGCS